MRLKKLLPLLVLTFVLTVPVYADGVMSDPPAPAPTPTSTLDGVMSDPPVAAPSAGTESDLLATIVAVISAILP